MRGRILVGLIGLFFAVSAGLAEAQERRVTLLDLLFGNRQEQAQPTAPQQQTQTTSRPSTRPTAPSASVTVIAEPAVNKNDDATRLLVMGDSLAVDLAKSLERTFAEDPNLLVLNKGVGSSGFVRDDFYDWNAALSAELSADGFDVAVVIVGINDRQNLGGNEPLTEEWRSLYNERINRFLSDLRAAGKPVLWVGLPPMNARSYSQAMSEISSLHRLASLANGAEFVDIYERFTDEAGNYTASGPDLNGQMVSMRKSDGIHFSTAGSDKVAFYVSQALERYYAGGRLGLEVADLLAGTDAAEMTRLPFQGQGQVRLLEVAGAVLPLTQAQAKATELILAPAVQEESEAPFTLADLAAAPVGRADAFGVGLEPSDTLAEDDETTDQQVLAN